MSAANPPMLTSFDTKLTEKQQQEIEMKKELAEYAKFCAAYAIYPQDEHVREEQFKRCREGKDYKINPNDVPRTTMPKVPFYIVTPDGRKPVTAHVTDGVNVMYKGMPGAYTPVCDGTDLKGVLNLDVLKRLKQECKVDVIAILVKNDAAVAWHWLANKVAQAGLPEDVIAKLEHNNPNARVAIRADIPVIMILPNPDMSLANFLGLVINAPGLDFTVDRVSVFVGPERDIRTIVKAENTGLAACLKDLHGERMFIDAKEAFAPRVSSELTAKV